MDNFQSIIIIFIPIATFAVGWIGRARSDGKSSGVSETKLDHMALDIKDIKAQMKSDSQRHSMFVERLIVVERDLKTLFANIDEIKNKER